MFRRLENGAEVEMSIVEKPINGAVEQANGVYAVKNGAEEDVWANARILTLLSNSVTYGICNVSEDGLTFDFFKHMDYWDGAFFGSMSGAGTIVLYLDGQWTNPKIEFDWSGGFTRSNSEDSSGSWFGASAGSISLYHRNASGTTNTTEVVPTIGWVGTSTEGIEKDSGSYSGTLNGTFNRLGLSIKISGYAGNYFSALSEMTIKNLRINGTKVGFPETVEFDKQEWAS